MGADSAASIRRLNGADHHGNSRATSTGHSRATQQKVNIISCLAFSDHSPLSFISLIIITCPPPAAPPAPIETFCRIPRIPCSRLLRQGRILILKMQSYLEVDRIFDRSSLEQPQNPRSVWRLVPLEAFSSGKARVAPRVFLSVVSSIVHY